MNSPAVSIILPTQGARASLRAALRSALAQDFSAFEVVLVDDAPAGRTDWKTQPELVPLLADSRVRVVPFHQARGCAAAKNAGWRAARGEWLCYLDDDNEYRPAKLSAQHALAVAQQSPVVLCGLEIRASGRRRVRQVHAGSLAGDELLLDVVADTNVLFHRRDAPRAWDESLGTVDDACLFQALLAHYGLSRVPSVPEPLAIYHAHTGARANRGFERFYRGQRCLVTRWSRRYSPRARRVLLLRSLVAFTKYRPHAWSALLCRSGQLLRAGGWREWRVVLNAAGVRLPLLRRWLVT